MSCHSGKKEYTKKEAATIKNLREQSGSGPLRIYACPDCNWWHLTKAIRRYKK